MKLGWDPIDELEQNEEESAREWGNPLFVLLCIVVILIAVLCR